ncbi:DUF3794 domain-containing protein [Bacillota bacterium]
MEYKNDLINEENIPDFALQPARPASSFDPTVYDRLFENLKQAAGEIEVTEPIEEVEEVAEAEPVEEAEEVAAAEPVEEAEEVAAAEPVEEAEEVAAAAAPPHIKEELTPISAGRTFSPKEPPRAGPAAATAVPAANQKTRAVKYTEVSNLEPVIIQIEEDVLITDSKPDMAEMLCIEGSCRLSERSAATGENADQPVRIAGDLKIQALYASEKDEGGSSIISLETRIPFREDRLIKANQLSNLSFRPRVKYLKWEKINERKFKVRAGVEVGVREYCPKEFDLFEGLADEELQLLQGEMEYSDVAIKKTDIIDVSEDISIPDGAPEIDKILCYSVNITENQKQVIGGKAMVNGTAWINVLYDSAGGPEFHTCKTDITHFIKVNENETAAPLIGGRAFFDVVNCSLTPKRDENGAYSILSLDMEADAGIEYSSQVQERCIEDLYHNSKDVECDRIQKEFKCLRGSGTADIPLREIIDMPERYSGGGKVIYITGAPEIRTEQAEWGRISIEGVLPVRMVCLAGENEKKAFAIDRELDFRADLDLAGCREGMITDCQTVLTSLQCKQINGRQAAVNAEIAVSGQIFEKTAYNLIKSAAITERQVDLLHGPSIIVYASKDGDTVWKVSKKYHIPASRIRAVNNLSEHEEIKAGSKIVIVR